MSCHPLFYKNFKEITKGYGWLEYDPKSEAYHPGFDYNKNNGKGANGDLDEPIHLVKRGIIRYAQDTKGGYGLLTVAEHEDGTYSKYAHQNKILVTVGQLVEEGEIIGLTGKSGTASVHCHHELLTNKLVESLKKSNPKKWYTYYPNSKSKAWVVENYINPLTAHTYPPPQAEIKKNMTIKLLFCVNDTVENRTGLASKLNKEAEYWGSLLHVNIQWTIKTLAVRDIKWSGERIERRWAGYNVIPHASGYDGCVLWITPEEWKGNENHYGYSDRESIFGVHFIALKTPIDWTNTLYPDGDGFLGALKHEKGHFFIQRTRQYCPLNETKEHKVGNDNTHYFDYVIKDLSRLAKEVHMEDFEGWKPKVGTRLFSYIKPTAKKKEFSGQPISGKVYSSTDSRMFFIFTAFKGFEIIPEHIYTEKVNEGALHGSMSVEEANYIYSGLKIPVPEQTGKVISMQLATGFREKLLRLRGWQETIPL